MRAVTTWISALFYLYFSRRTKSQVFSLDFKRGENLALCICKYFLTIFWQFFMKSRKWRLVKSFPSVRVFRIHILLIIKYSKTIYLVLWIGNRTFRVSTPEGDRPAFAFWIKCSFTPVPSKAGIKVSSAQPVSCTKPSSIVLLKR